MDVAASLRDFQTLGCAVCIPDRLAGRLVALACGRSVIEVFRRSDVRSYNRRRELASCRTSTRVSGGGHGAAIFGDSWFSQPLGERRLSRSGVAPGESASARGLDFEPAAPARLR